MAKADVQQRLEGAVDTSQITVEQLQKECRMMELNRKAYAEESQEILRKQQTCIAMLMKENASLKAKEMLTATQLNVGTSHQETASQIEKCKELSTEASHYASVTEQERLASKKMEEEAGVLKRKLLHARRLLGGINAASDNEQMIEKQIRNVENRLDKASTKFNDVLNQNKKLRKSIEGLQREKATYNSMNQKLEKDIKMKKKEIAAIIERSNMAYEQRDKFQVEMSAIEKADWQEQSDFTKQMVILNKELEQAFMNISKRRLSVNISGIVSPTPTDSTHFWTEPPDGGPKSKNTRKQQKILTARDDDDDSSTECVLQFMEAAWDKTNSATEEEISGGVHDAAAQVALTSLMENEDKNFRLFNHVIEQHNEIEMLESQVQSLHAEERLYTHKVGAGRRQNKQTFETIQSHLKATQTAITKHVKLCTGIEKELDNLRNEVVNVKAMLSKTNDYDCPLPSSIDGCSKEEEVTEANIIVHLAFIEQEVITVLQQYNKISVFPSIGTTAVTSSKSIEQGNTTTYSVALGVGPHATTMRQDLLHIVPPKLEYYSNGEEEEGNGSGEDGWSAARPLTHVELRENASIVKLKQRGRHKTSSGWKSQRKR